MEVLRSDSELYQWRRHRGSFDKGPLFNSSNRQNQCLVYIPTMGALHEGHRALVEKAHTVKGPGGGVLVSIFVNPLQFDQKEDLIHYPSTWQEDLDLLTTLKVDAVYAPQSPQEFVPQNTLISPLELGESLHGRARPGHLAGVCTILMKFFLQIQPTHAIFGAKDYQQWLVVQSMVDDYNLPIKILSIPTVREASGLACSSRNTRLSEQARRHDAPFLRRTLLKTREIWRAKKLTSQNLVGFFEKTIATNNRIILDYVIVLSGDTLRVVCASQSSQAMIFSAITLEGVQLIDHIELE